MAFTVNGELVEDSVIRAEASALRPRYEEVAQNMDPIEAEMQLRDWSRENVIERVLLRQDAANDPEPISAEAIEETLQSAGPQAERNDIEIRMRIDRLVERITSKVRSEEHTSELQSRLHLVCRLLLEKKPTTASPVRHAS